MCDKVVNTHSSAIQFVPEGYKIQKMCDNTFNKCFLAFFLFLININLKKYVTKLFLMILFSIRYVHDEYKTQQMCDKAVDDLFLIGLLQVK